MSAGALSSTLDLGFRLPRLDSSFTPVRTRSAARYVTQRLGDGLMSAEPDAYDLDALHRRVREAWQSGRGDLRELGRRDLRRLPWVLCYSPTGVSASTGGAGHTGAAASLPTLATIRRCRDIASLNRVEAGIERHARVFTRSQLDALSDALDARRADLERAGSSGRSDVAAWLAADLRLLRKYGEWLREDGPTRAVRTLLQVFLRDYPAHLGTFGHLRRMLETEVSRRRPGRRQADWALRCRRYGLLKEDGARSFVGSAIGSKAAVPELLRDAGLSGPLERSEFLREGLLLYLSTTGAAKKLVLAKNPAKLQRLLTLLQCEGRLRFGEPKVRRVIAESLLAPLVANAPSSEVKEELQRFFLRCFGDPRLPSGRSNWSGVSDDVQRVIMRWLNEQTIELFFRVVEKTAHDRHWRYRRAFWKTCFDDGLIDDVWFVLGRGARDQLRSLEDDSGATEATGALIGAAYGQSVLLMRMASGVTISEWSHSGACRLWLGGNRAAPRMYGPEYTRHDLFHDQDHRQVHHGSETGNWQHALADWLEENTGLMIDRSDFPGGSWRNW